VRHRFSDASRGFFLLTSIDIIGRAARTSRLKGFQDFNAANAILRRTQYHPIDYQEKIERIYRIYKIHGAWEPFFALIRHLAEALPRAWRAPAAAHQLNRAYGL
jgi:hypothetical protein